MASIFLPMYAIHCVEQVYFIYGNVLESYGFSPQTIGNALGSFFVAIMIARPLGGWMTETLGIKRTLAIGAYLAFTGCSMLAFTRDATLICAGRAISGVAFGVFTMGLFSYQALVTTPETRGKYFALTTCGGVLPTATVTPLGEWLVLGGHFRLFLAIGPIVSAASLYFGLKVAPDKTSRAGGKKEWGSYRDLVRSRPFVMLTLTGMMMALVDASVTSVSLFAAERNLVASYFLATYSIIAVVSRILGAKLLNALPRQFCVAPCGMLMALSLAAISLVPSNMSFLACGIIFGFGVGWGFPMMLASLSDILPPELRPNGTALALLLYDLNWAATPLIVGYLTPSLGRAYTFAALSAFTLAALAALSVFYWIPRRKSENRALGGKSAAVR
jgi:MFS family permease